MRQPPTLATALLRGLAHPDEAVLGDLVEQFQTGRSRLWYWGQAVSLIAFSSMRDVRAHPILTIRAIVALRLLLWVTVLILYYAMRFDEALFTRGSGGQIALICFAWLMCAVCGWIVARLHRPYGVPMLVANVGFDYLWMVLLAPTLHATPLGVLNLVMYPMLTFSGGIFERARHPSSHMADRTPRN